MVDVVVDGGENKASSVKLKLGAGTELGNVLSSSRIASTSLVSQILRSPPKYPLNNSTNGFFYTSVTMGKVGPIYSLLEVSSSIDLLTSKCFSISLPPGTS